MYIYIHICIYSRVWSVSLNGDPPPAGRFMGAKKERAARETLYNNEAVKHTRTNNKKKDGCRVRSRTDTHRHFTGFKITNSRPTGEDPKRPPARAAVGQRSTESSKPARKASGQPASRGRGVGSHGSPHSGRRWPRQPLLRVRCPS